MNAYERAIEKALSEAKREQYDAAFVLELLDEIFRRKLYIRSMEAFEIDADGSETLRIDLSVLGLDENWEAHASLDRKFARRVVEEKLNAALACENPVKYVFWLDELKRV